MGNYKVRCKEVCVGNVPCYKYSGYLSKSLNERFSVSSNLLIHNTNDLAYVTLSFHA